MAVIREYARRMLPSGDNRKERIPFEKVEEACKVFVHRPSGRPRGLTLAAAISLDFCGFLRNGNLADSRRGSIIWSSDGASVETFLESRKNDQHR